MNDSVKWAAQLEHVREVSLLGTADLTFWTDRLAMEGLLPDAAAGQARLLIIAADSRFMGIPFRELSLSVLVRWQEHQGAFLLRAFNSCRCFAFCERVLFSTPYYHGDVRVSAELPAAVRLAGRGGAVFRAEMAAHAPATAPARSGQDGWEGPVFLPARRRAKAPEGRLFFARLRGHTQTYPFDLGVDSLTIRPGKDGAALQALLESRFVPREWIVRAAAAHAKSKTYERSDALRHIPPQPPG